MFLSIPLRVSRALLMKTSKGLTFRSGLERAIAESLERRGVPYSYESLKITYLKPAREAKYTPDFILPNGVIVEGKGRFLTEDRQKHLLIKDQHPEKDIRFVFSNAHQRISKTSKTTYAKWCESKGFLWADKRIPEEWLEGR
jgi:hypothetical protein